MKRKLLIALSSSLMFLPIISAKCNESKSEKQVPEVPSNPNPSTAPMPNPDPGSSASKPTTKKDIEKKWDTIFRDSPTGLDITSKESYKSQFENYKKVLLASLSSLEKKINEADKKYELLEKQHKSEIEKHKNDFESDKTVIESEIVKNNNDIDALENTVLAKAKNELAETIESLKDLEDILQGANEEKEFYSKLSNENGDFINTKAKDIKSRIEKLTKAAESGNSKLSELKSKIEELIKEFPDTNNKELEYVKKYFSIIYDHSIQNIKAFIIEGKKREQKSLAEVKDFEIKLAKLKEKDNELKAKLEELLKTSKSISELEKKYEQEELDLERQVYKYEEDKNHRQRKIEELDKSIKEIEKLSKK